MTPIESKRKELDEGCDGFEEYWGHKCGIWITNKAGENVHVICNSCKGKLEGFNLGVQMGKDEARKEILDIWEYANKEAMNTKQLLREVKYRIEQIKKSLEEKR